METARFCKSHSLIFWIEGMEIQRIFLLHSDLNRKRECILQKYSNCIPCFAKTRNGNSEKARNTLPQVSKEGMQIGKTCRMHSRGHTLRGRGHRQLGQRVSHKPAEEPLRVAGVSETVVVKPKNTPKEDEERASQRDPEVLRIALMIYGTSSAHFGNS